MTTKSRRFWGTKDTASCIQVMRVLQSYLDGHTDEVTARRVSNHLEACLRCGLEAATYTEIKAALARRAPQADPSAIERLRAFGAELGRTTVDDGDAGQSPPPA